MKRLLVLLFALAVTFTYAQTPLVYDHAHPQRPLFSKENQFPRQYHWEVGAVLGFTEFVDQEEDIKDSLNAEEIALYARYGLFRDVSLQLTVPYVEIDGDFDDDNGLGDVELELQLRAWEDLFDYPFVIPHFAVNFGNGVESEELLSGERVYEAGISWGTVVADQLTFIADGSYHVRSERENEFVFASSVIWDVGRWSFDRRFSVLGEVQVHERRQVDFGSRPVLFLGGLVYDWSEALQFSFYGGGGKDTIEDVFVRFKTAYTF